jgi:hypothetical protein
MIGAASGSFRRHLLDLEIGRPKLLQLAILRPRDEESGESGLEVPRCFQLWPWLPSAWADCRIWKSHAMPHYTPIRRADYLEGNWR